MRSIGLLAGLTLLLQGVGVAEPAPVEDDARRELALGQQAFAQRGRAPLRRALRHFEAAAGIDPNLAEAHAGVAASSSLLALYGHERPAAVMPAAREAGERALRLNAGLPEARASLGLVAYLYEWDYPKAERLFRQALQQEPVYPELRHWYAMLLRATARYEEALAQIDRAIEQSPESALYRVKRGTILLAAGRLDAAARELDAAIVRHPEFAMAVRERGFVALERGAIDRALEYLERASALSPSKKTRATVLSLRARVGSPEPAREMLAALRRGGADTYESPLIEAILCLGWNDVDGALAGIARAFDERDPAVVYIARQAIYRPLRGDPRFLELVASAGLPSP